MPQGYTSGNIETKIWEHEQAIQSHMDTIDDALIAFIDYLIDIKQNVDATEIDADLKEDVNDSLQITISQLGKVRYVDFNESLVEAFSILLEDMG